MKTLNFIIIIITMATSAFSQTNRSPVEIKDIVLSPERIINFISKEFKPFTMNRQKLFEVKHPLEANKFNRVIKDTDLNYTLNGLPLNALYAYVKKMKSK